MAGLNQQIEQLKQSNEKTQELLYPTNTNIYDYVGGRFLTSDTDAKTQSRYQAANRVGDALWKLYQINSNPSDYDLEAALGNDAIAWNMTYGDPEKKHANNAATIFGAGSLMGKLTPSQRQSINNYIAKRTEYENQRKAAENNRALEAYENNYKFKYGDNGNVYITKGISDKIKEIGNLYADYAEKTEELRGNAEMFNKFVEQAKHAGAKRNMTPVETPDDVYRDKRKELVSAMRQQLKAAGINVGDAPAEGEYDSVEKLIESAPDWETENAIRKAIGLGTTRTEYKPEEKNIGDMLRERQAMQAEAELRAKQRELDRKRNREGIAGLAATIGDMIKASEGAKVSPRDWQRIYDELTAQERANVNNYQVRMQKMRDDANAERLAAAQQAAKLAADREQREWEEKQLDKKLGFKRDEKEKDRNLRWLLGGDREYGRTGGRGGGGRRPSQTNIRAFGDTTFIDSSQYNSTMDNIYGMLKAIGIDMGIEDKILGIDKTSEIVARTSTALQSLRRNGDNWTITTPKGTYAISNKDADMIKAYIRQVASGRSSSPEPQEPSAGNNTSNTGGAY